MKTRSHSAGYTFVEMLAAVAMSAVVLGAAVLVYHSIIVNQERLSLLVEVDLGAAGENYYGAAGTLYVYSAPNFGRAGFAEDLRETFWKDVEGAAMVHCLSRDDPNTVRPGSIPFDTANPPSVDTPNAFKAVLEDAFPAAATIFQDYRGPAADDNLSIFVVGPPSAGTEMPVLAVYDIDFTNPAGKSGIYASVRRYQGGALTSYYDIYYETGPGEDFSPVAVFFERKALSVFAEAASVEAFKKAEGSPFYLIWWPDPAARFLETPYGGATYPVADPRNAYAHMGGRTSLSFVVPAFPAL